MPRSNALHAKSWRAWTIALIFSTGCAHSQTDLQNSLARRVTPVEIAEDQSKSRSEITTAHQTAKDVMVRRAAASQPEQATATERAIDRSVPPLPVPAIPPSSVVSGPSSSTTAFLPSDSDDAALDAVSANGRPLSLSEAIHLAFRFQPRLHAQLESIAQARGQQQIAFSAFLPIAGVNYDVGEYSLGVGGEPIGLGKGLPNFSFLPGLGALPVGLNIGTNFELAELKVQWLLLDFGRRMGRYQQARLANDVAALQTDRAYQTVANEVAVAYYNVLRSQALRRTAQDALRRSEEELADARKREREGVVERENVLRSEVQNAETRQLLHAATQAEFVALAALNLAIGLKCNQPVRVAEVTESPPLSASLCAFLETAIRERREFQVVQRTVEIAVEGTRVARAEFAPKVIANGLLFNFQQQQFDGHADFRLGFIRLDWTLFEGGRRIAASRVAASEVRQAMAQAESIADNIAFQVNEAYRNAVTAWVGIDDARPAVEQSHENYRLVQLRLREGAATPTEIADAQAALTHAEQNYENARYSYLIALACLDYAMGVGPTPMTLAAAHH
ncbi:MAG: TolC family protein [Isosphaeraceae bacterium]